MVGGQFPDLGHPAGQVAQEQGGGDEKEAAALGRAIAGTLLQMPPASSAIMQTDHSPHKISLESGVSHREINATQSVM